MKQLELDEIQGLVFSGYGNKPHATYLLLKIHTSKAGQRYLAWLAERITTGAMRPERICLNVALTATGLQAVRLPESELKSFPAEFVEGVSTSTDRSRILGDLGESAPEEWVWGSPGDPVDLLVMAFASGYAELERELAAHREWYGSDIQELYARSTRALDARREHFGFVDGISSPQIAETGRKKPHQLSLKAGEFVLGYANEYGKLPFSPQVADDDTAQRYLPDGSSPGTRDLGRNGSYLVARQIDQRVARFWGRMLELADGDRDRAVLLASKCVGRWPDGTPLTLSPERGDQRVTDLNDFDYLSTDRKGYGCPVGAHIRRANPRDSLDPDPAQSRKVVARHSMIRRGRSYGPPLERFENEPREAERGLFFICVNANIARQFEFVQQTWLNNPKFGGLPEGRDPLVGGSHTESNQHRIPGQPFRNRLNDLPSFTRIRGSAYFFLPSRAALKYLSQRGAG